MRQGSQPLRRTIARYLLSVLLVLVAAATVRLLRPGIGVDVYFTPFTAVIVFTAWFAGFGPALVATALTAALNLTVLAAPAVTLLFFPDVLRVVIFTAVGALLSSLIEARRRLLADVSEQSQRLAVTMASMGDAVIVTDAAGCVESMNPVAEQITGERFGAIRGLPLARVFRLVDEVTRVPVDDPVARVLASGTIARLANHMVLVRRDGREVPIDDSAAPVKAADGHVLGAVLLFRDVTERRAVQARLERQALLIEQAYDAIFVRDLDRRVVFWNPAASAVYGWSPEEAIGRDPHELLHTRFPGNGTADELEAELREHRAWEGEVLHRRRDGTELVMESRQVMVRDEAGRPAAILEINRDVTERKRAEAGREEALAEAERANRVKDEFLTTLSHELRTPLNAILGWAQMLLADAFDPAMWRHAVETIRRNAEAQTVIVNDVLDVSRIITGRLKLDVGRVDVAAVLADALETVRPAAEAKRIDLVTEVPTAPVALIGDASRLQQVVWNLLSNAIKFTPAGGRVHVAIRRVGSHVQLAVRDTGIGIAPEFLPHVFERFVQADSSTTRRHAGLGLGLAIVKHLIELHGGTVQVDSGGAGQGATFTVRLPVGAIAAVAAADADAGRPGARAAPAADLAGLRVLVVDDEEDAREIVSLTLERAGAQVTLAASAEEAARATERETFDLLVCDIGMPNEDGYQLMRRLRRRGLATPAIALTAYGQLEHRARAIAAGYQEHLPKPTAPGILTASASRLVGAAR